MQKRSSKNTPINVNTQVFHIVERATKEPEPRESKKNPHAVALGRLGGIKGGRARAEKLSSERRQEIAKKAAAKRWHNA